MSHTALSWTAVVVVTAAAATPVRAQPPIPEPSPRLAELHFQLGEWETTTKFMDPTGKVVREREGREVTTLEHGGLLVRSLTYIDERPEPVARRWQYFDRYKKRLYDVSFDLVGHFERRREERVGDLLAFAFPEPESFQDGVFRDWRKTYSDVTANSYRVTWAYSEDGEDWTAQIVIDFRRAASTGDRRGE